MPESPDFEAIARRIVEAAASAVGTDNHEALADQIHEAAEQLRLVWNARGAVDVAKLDAELAALGVGYAGMLGNALRKPDR